MTILKHKDAYINSFKRAITGEEKNISSPSVDSNSPYYAEINEENSVASFAYELGSVLSESVSSGSGAVDPQYALKDHNHDNIYAKIVHNHDDRYYTKAEEDVWRDRLINGDLLFNKINAKHIQAGTIIAGSSIIANGAIGNAHINSVSADKIDAGVIDTSKITVCGANGNLKLRGNRLQVFEGVGNEQFERVSLGDVDNDGSVYGLRVRGKDGNTILYDENGVYREGITDGSISNDKIGDDANIDGFKLNIHSVIENINDNNTGTIHGTKIDIDGEGLSSKIYDIVMDQNEHSETIKRQEAQIKQNSEEIKLKVGSQEYIEDMASMSSKLTKVESDVEILNEGIKLTASKTEVENQINNLRDFVSDEIGDISIGGANYINNSAPRKATLWDLPEWDTTINGKHRLNYWQDYNEYVELPQVGYHPHIDLDTFHFPCIALINKNGNFDMANRELSLKQELYESDKFIEEEINYVLSFDAYSDTPGFSFTGGLYHKVLESYEYNYYSGMMDITIDKEHINTWERKSYSFTTRVGIDISEPMYLVINGHNNPEGSGYIKNIKLEKSNIVSQWTPSQFDVDDSINDVVDSMKDYTNESIRNYSSTVDVLFDGITTKVSATEKDLSGVKGSVSEISQKANSLTTTVSDLSGKYTQIKQTVDSIDLTGVVKFDDLSTNGSTTIHGGNIKANTLAINSISSNNAHPIIRLFPHTDGSGNTAYCSIDATQQYEQGQGTAIRLKWDSMNYILQKRNNVDFYMEPRESGSAFRFCSDYGEHSDNYESRIETKEGTLCFRRSDNDTSSTSSLYYYTGSGNYDRKILTTYDLSNSYSSSSSDHAATSYAVKTAYDKACEAYDLASSNSGGRGDKIEWSNTNIECFTDYLSFVAGGCEIRLNNGSEYGAGYKLFPMNSATDLGSNYATKHRWRYIFAQSSVNTSDVKSKENIRYLDDNLARFGDNNTPFLDFIKNDFRPATYNYKAHREEEGILDIDRQIGFIANDIIDSEVGKTFLYNFGTEEDTDIMYSPTGYTTVVARALQEEIQTREKLEERVAQLEDLVNKLLKKGDE